MNLLLGGGHQAVGQQGRVPPLEAEGHRLAPGQQGGVKGHPAGPRQPVGDRALDLDRGQLAALDGALEGDHEVPPQPQHPSASSSQLEAWSITQLTAASRQNKTRSWAKAVERAAQSRRNRTWTRGTR